MSAPPASITLSGIVQRATRDALLIRFGDVDAWLPRAGITVEPPNGLAAVLVTLPGRLAAEKGLLAVAAAGQGRLL